MTSRCGECQNCLDLNRVRARVLAVANHPFSHADNGVVDLWNTELARLPCTNPPIDIRERAVKEVWAAVTAGLMTKIEGDRMLNDIDKDLKRQEAEDVDEEALVQSRPVLGGGLQR